MQHATGMDRKKMLRKRRQPQKNMYYIDSIYVYVKPKNKNTDSMSVEIRESCGGLEINYKGARETV